MKINEVLIWMDSVEKAHNVIFAIQFAKASERVSYVFELYPETKNWTHEKIACLLGLQRETVTRFMNSEGIYRRVKM